MKKVKIYNILIALILVVLIGCSKEDTSGFDKVATGTIKAIEASTFQYGSHILQDANNNTLYALTSTTVDLNAYNNLTVKVIGNLIEGYPVDGGPEYLDVKIVQMLTAD